MVKKEYILGIDTGGTYTDSVVLDAVTKKVLAYSKALTTKENLQVGIQKSIETLDFAEFSQICLVCLSTTLATNAIVEGKGCKTGLILIGKSLDEIPAQTSILVKGQVDIHGNILENISKEEIISAAEQLGKEVEAIAVSCYASVRNPKLECAVKEIVENISHKPVFCAHELTGSLGFYERTVTSVLNACLIKMIEDFILSTKAVLEKKQIISPIMVVKGDGSLMHETIALERPIETILSGPAASTIGAGYLTDIDNAFVIDMGGTTSDIINIDNGTAKICPQGATVGGWRTRVMAANVCTYGLGGDSLISFNDKGAISIGPEKVEPLCITAELCENAKKELSSIDNAMDKEPVHLYRKGKLFADMLLSNEEKRVIKAVGDNAYTKHSIAKILRIDDNQLHLNNLIKNGGLRRCSITPTDILHASGQYTAFDRDVSRIALEHAATLCSHTLPTFLDAVAQQITKQLCLCLIQSAAAFEDQSFDFQHDEASMYLFEKAFGNHPNEFLQANFSLNKPIVGVGAPAHAWLPAVAKKLDVPLIIPKHAQVTSAIGAALGQVSESVSAVIRPSRKEEEFILYLPKETMTFHDKEEALQYAKEQLYKQIENKTICAGGNQIEITLSVSPIYTQNFNSKKRTYIETRIDAFAVAAPLILSKT